MLSDGKPVCAAFSVFVAVTAQNEQQSGRSLKSLLEETHTFRRADALIELY